MKPLAVKFVARPLLGALFLTGLVWGGSGGLRAQTVESAVEQSAPVQSVSPTPAPAGAKTGKKSKKPVSAEKPADTPRAKTPKEIPFPLPINEPATDLKIPETDLAGKVLSLIMAAKANRLDNERVEMKEMKMDLNHPDGKEDFHVVLPTSIFNLKTRIITSNEVVTVQTQDFELTGEGMEFNTVDRTGRLLGKVRMLIHNLKQVAGQEQPTPKPE